MFRIVKFLFYSLFAIFSMAFIVYLLLPAPALPPPPPNSLTSPEPADRAFSLRPAYFNQDDRKQTMDYYKNYFVNYPHKGVALFTYRLNYPPEDSSFLVRPHMYSSYLEEVVHPFRESLFINGFSPKEQKDDIWIYGVHYNQKITVKYIPSSLYPRLLIGASALVLLLMVIRELSGSTKLLLGKKRDA